MDRIYATWRSEWVQKLAGEADERCPFCSIVEAGLKDSESDKQNYVVFRSDTCFVVLNLYPYGSGHLLVLPTRHLSDLSDLTPEEKSDLWGLLEKTIRVAKYTYHPDGINFGANLGRSAGAGIPNHFHMHVLPRWAGDSGFITTIGDTRVISESLEQSYSKLVNNWNEVS